MQRITDLEYFNPKERNLTSQYCNLKRNNKILVLRTKDSIFLSDGLNADPIRVCHSTNRIKRQGQYTPL